MSKSNVRNKLAFRIVARHKQVVLMHFLSDVARDIGAAKHVYVVGGAVRNWLINKPIKDIDVVVDSVALGHDSAWFAQQVAKRIPTETNIATNNYGVAILTVKGDWFLEDMNMKGEVIEIANARKESYSEGGYKPTDVQPATIKDDVTRREFTFNTLLWRLYDLADGPEKAQILDLTGRGRKDLEKGILKTPLNPDKTFSDDPTRILRAIKFVARYGFKIPPDVRASLIKNAPKLKNVPPGALQTILIRDILNGPAPHKSLKLMRSLGITDVLKEIAESNRQFAKTLSRALSKKETLLLLDFLDLGFALSTPINDFTKKQQQRLREVLLSLPKDKAAQFYAKLIKPPIKNQMDLFIEFDIPRNERKSVRDLARAIVLAYPEISVEGLNRMLRSELAKTW